MYEFNSSNKRKTLKVITLANLDDCDLCCCEAMGSLQRLCLMLVWLAGSPLWSKERNEAIVVQMGVSLVLQCRPPAGLPPPVIFWMDNSESFACIHICTHGMRTKEFDNQ